MSSGLLGKGKARRAFRDDVRALMRVISNEIAGAGPLDDFLNIFEHEFISAGHLKHVKSGRPDNLVELVVLMSANYKRLRKVLDRPGDRPGRRRIGALEGVVKGWASDPDFLDPETGQPSRLLIEGPGNTFDRLVERKARGATRSTVIKPLVAQGVVSVVNTYWIELLKPHWVPQPPIEAHRQVRQMLKLLREWSRESEA